MLGYRPAVSASRAGAVPPGQGCEGVANTFDLPFDTLHLDGESTSMLVPLSVPLRRLAHRLRTDCVGHAAKAFQAAGVAIPTAVTPLGPIPEPETAAVDATAHSPCSDKKLIHRLTA
jgi:hypothetical protein